MSLRTIEKIVKHILCSIVILFCITIIGVCIILWVMKDEISNLLIW